MAEVLVFVSVVQATTQLVEQAFQIFGRLRKAYKLQQNVFNVLTTHQNEIASLKGIIRIIAAEEKELLEDPTVATELARMQTVQEKLADLLVTLDPAERGKVNQFTHQLVHGTTEQKKLSDIMFELAQVKSMLLLCIQVSHVGVTRSIRKKIVANADVIRRIDQTLRERVENFKGLRIAWLLKDRHPSEDGTVPLSPADLVSLDDDDSSENSQGETFVDDSETCLQEIPPKIKRIVRYNSVDNQAIQINAPLETDIWKDVNLLVVERNEADNQGIQLNYPITREMMMVMFEQQNKVIAATRQTTGGSRHDHVVVKASVR